MTYYNTNKHRAVGGSGRTGYRIVLRTDTDTFWESDIGLVGGSGNDTLSAVPYVNLFGSYSNFGLYGGPGNDILNGGWGADILQGDEGNDTLWGGDGNDTLAGLEGNAVLHGGSGNDNLGGGWGDDILYGDVGNDSFDFHSNGGGVDTVYGGNGIDELYGAGVLDVISFTDVEILSTLGKIVYGSATKFNSLMTIRVSGSDTTGTIALA